MNNLSTTIQTLTKTLSIIELPTITLPITLPTMNFELPTIELSLTTILLINSAYFLTFYSIKWYNNYQHSNELKSLQNIIDSHDKQMKEMKTTFNNKIKQHEETLKENETLINILQKRSIKQDELKQNSDSYKELKGKNKILKEGCKDLLNKLTELVETNEELKCKNKILKKGCKDILNKSSDLVDSNKELKQELVNVDADIFNNDEDIKRLTNLNKLLEKEIIEQKIEIIKLRKKSKVNYKC